MPVKCVSSVQNADEPAALAARDRDWWLGKLDGLTTGDGGEAFHELPTDYRRPAGDTAKAAAPLVERLDASTVAGLTRLARTQQVELHSVLLALLAAEARRRGGRGSLIVGSGISVCPPGAEGPLGDFVNLLPLILTDCDAMPLAAQIRATDIALAEAVEHAAYPSASLYREFRERHPDARPPACTSLFDLSLTSNPSGDAGADFGLTSSHLPEDLAYRAAGVDLDFSHEPIDGGGGLELSLVWNTGVYSRSTARAWLSSFADWARWLAEDASRANCPLPALLPAEAQCLERWERGPVVARPAKRFHELVESLADLYPDRPAVIAEAGTQSYAELERSANRIARVLLDRGVAREETVGVLTECSADLPATVLGIWKAGAAYLPLTLDQPPDRLAFMAADAGARILIVLDGHAVPPSLARAVTTILRLEDWARAADRRTGIDGSPQDLAFIIYTSGTTGKPKGVLIQHDGLVNSVCMIGEAIGLRPDDRISLAATPGFDASLWELGTGLLHGMAIVPVSRALRDDPWALKRWYKTQGVTVAFHAPSYLRVSQQTPFDGLRILLTGGEAPNHGDARSHAGYLALWNGYGPTETCIMVCGERLSPHPDASRPLPAGRPFANIRISIRRDNGDPAPPGSLGEVWLGGTGPARGYLNNPKLTAERFVETPEGRFYRSGDLGRWTEDGRLELAGRRDRQVKLQGQRAELGEIEEALRSLPAVEEAVVLVEASANDTQVLLAFVRVSPGGAAPAEDEWRRHLGDRLPLYMLPASVIPVAAIPLTSAGKIDRDALLRCPRERSEGAAKSPPRDEFETRVAAVWEELLGAGVSREDNFFALGGNSLLAVTLAHRLSGEFSCSVPARELFAAPTLAGFAQRLAAILLAAVPGSGAHAAALARSDSATEGQREFRIAEAAGLDTRTFTIPLLCKVEGEMPSVDRWNSAWARLVARHEALRTYFVEDAGGRVYRDAAPVLTQTLEIAKQPDSGAARTFVRQRQSDPFIMGVPPLWRAGLVEVADSGEHLFWLALHHSVGDGRSLGIIVEELTALLSGEELVPVAGDFADSAAREEAYLAGPECAADVRYWHDLLARQPDPAFAEGPLDFPRSGAAKTGSHRFETRLDADTAQGLKALARRHEASLHAVMLTLLALEARRRTGREAMIVGTTASIRETAAEAQVIGYYVNMLPLPCHLPRQIAFGAALRETQQALASALQHARYPFARIYRDFWNERPQLRHPARYPLFDLAVTENPESHSAPAALRLARSAAIAAYELSDASPGEDMVLSHEGLADGGLLLQWHVNAALYTRETAACWLAGLSDWAAWLAEDPQRASEPFPGLLPRESALLEGWEQGAKVPRPSLRFHEIFERVVDIAGVDGTPGMSDRPAIVTAGGITTYAALEREANVIAHGLLLRGAVSGTVVGVLTGRSANLPAAVLGIWKAGATYLPLAADLPPERLEFMARDAGVTCLIALDGLAMPLPLAEDWPPPLRPEEIDDEFRRTHAHRPAENSAELVGRTPGSARVPLDPLFPNEINTYGSEEPTGAPAADPGARPTMNADCSAAGKVGHRPAPAAYIIYTSGSTGRAKGTSIGHDAYVNCVLGAGEILGLTPRDRSLMFASPSFDVSMSDIGLPLAFGASLCPVPYEVLSSPTRFRAFLTDLDVTVADVTPTYLRLFDGAELPSLRVLVTGGEAPFPADVAIYAGRHQYFNAYGPTENTISSTMGRLRPESGPKGPISGGRPLPNTSVHVCDSDGNSLPPGMTGELWLGGTGLASGYVGLPELTAAAFVETAKGRRYRTGDLGRWRADGEIEILGRMDEQVKLNGIRVELGEIEHALASHPDIAQAVALLDGDAERGQSLWAFVSPLPGKEVPAEEIWREYLAGRLPAYMIPSRVVAIAGIPLSNSGKVDKAALKGILAGRPSRHSEATPEDGLEARIAGVWSDLLLRGPIHREDNFFALGGHSLLAIAMAHRLEKALGRPVPARELFAEPTLRGFAQRIGSLGKAELPAAVSSDRATEGQREFWVAEQAGLDTRGFNIGLTLAAGAGIHSEARWRRAWAVLVRRHEALRTGFHQNRAGELRRVIVQECGAELEISAHPDMPAAIAHIRERQTGPLAMDSPPLWRAGLARVAGAEQPMFWLALHHSVADGVSLGVLTEELNTLLRGGTLPPVAGGFDESAGREESYLAGPESAADASYWRQVLGGLGGGSPDRTISSSAVLTGESACPTLPGKGSHRCGAGAFACQPIFSELPTGAESAPDIPRPFDEWPLDFPRPVGRTTRNARGSHCFRVRLDASTVAGLRDFAQQNGASLHALMLTIMALEVRRRTGRPAFLLGTAASTRDSAGEARTVGYYVNMIPVACRVPRGESIEQALRATQRSLAEGLHHARYPFARIYRDFRTDRPEASHPARYPLFDLSVTENPGVQDAQGGSFVPVASDYAAYDLRLNAPPQDMVLVHEGQPDGGIVLQWYVNAAIYRKETAGAWIDSLAGWARLLAHGKRIPDSPLPDLLPEEEALLAGWERGPAIPLPAASFPAWFEHWSRIQAERPALVTEQGELSYAALNARSNALAHALAAQGVGRQERVGVFTDRSIVLPETVLAIWKAGACYVPLVRDLPAERLAFMVRDAGIRHLVALDGLSVPESLTGAGCRIFRPESLSEAFLSSHGHALEGDGVTGSDLAYIIYTSGSTGTPKGVMLRHQGLNNLSAGMAAVLEIGLDDRVSVMASPAFDAWIAELVMAWGVGAAVVPILRSEMDDIAGMRSKFARLGVSAATMSPSYLRLFAQSDFPSLRTLITAGEGPHRADALYYAGRLRYFNGYGPTENTVAASFGRIVGGAEQLTAGRPMANTSMSIRGSEGEAVPPGAAGQVWMGGAQLAAGYLNRPELTAASFVETPAGRLYGSGDLGRWTHTGELEILGRGDGQVKLRGQRVELGEIEHRLGTHAGVRQGVAALETLADGTQTLWAFVCLMPGTSEPAQEEWHEYLSGALPSYMLPAVVLAVPEIPVNIAGKVDRDALLRSVSLEAGRADGPHGAPPREGMERSIAAVWAERLERPCLARDDNFFDLGGDSLKAISVVNQLRRTLHCAVNDLYEHPRLADFAATCQPQPEHLRTLLQSAARHWHAYRDGLSAYEAEHNLALTAARSEYAARNQRYRLDSAAEPRDYRRVFLTGATGYLGSYLLRELLADRGREVTVLVRGSDDGSARARLGETLRYYFGPDVGTALQQDSRLTVLAGDLRRDDLGLPPFAYHRLADAVQAVFHSAANVKHFGHYWEFRADNVAATARLLKLAAQRTAKPADFHLVSTLSTCGRAPETGFRLFTEYDAVPEALDENYYVRSKQEAERLVVAARGELANACIHRVGNLVFAAGGGPLQFRIEENAFFRQLAAFLRLGVAPDDSHLWLSHVDLAARGLVLLAGTAQLTNETHHLENARRDTVAGFLGAAEGIRAGGFDTFLERLARAVDEPGAQAALSVTLESFGLYRGVSPQERGRRLEIVTDRTQALLASLGLVWPPLPRAGQVGMLHKAARFVT